jgi:8-oxo-dGTP pyrophosphatase MutT (NUDIX family)
MTQSIQEFVEQNSLMVEEAAAWGEGGWLKMRVHSYATSVLPPLELISSVRCIVLRGEDEVLVLRDPQGFDYLAPGGQREPGETLEQTLRREVLEETGWEVGGISLIGCYHFHILVPVPADYPYAHPDFFQPVYVAQAIAHRPEAMVYDPYVVGSGFRKLAEVPQLDLQESQRGLLDVALAMVRQEKSI